MLTALGLQIGEAVRDGDGALWWVLNRPDGSGVCDGLFRSAGYGSIRQRYGEHMVQPVVRANHRCASTAPCSRPLEPHCPPMSATAAKPPWWSRLTCGWKR